MKYGEIEIVGVEGFDERGFVVWSNAAIKEMTERMWKSLASEPADDHATHIELHNRLLAQNAVNAPHDFEIEVDANGVWQIKPTSIPTAALPLKPAEPCRHEWKQYVGFTARYDYCGKCDAKRGQE